MLGGSIESSLFLVCHCQGGEGETIRTILAHKATGNERT